MTRTGNTKPKPQQHALYKHSYEEQVSSTEVKEMTEVTIMLTMKMTMITKMTLTTWRILEETLIKLELKS